MFLSPMPPTSQRLSLEPPRLPLTGWHPWNKTKEKQEGEIWEMGFVFWEFC